MAELADAPDLGSGGQPCGFESHYPYQTYRMKQLFCEKTPQPCGFTPTGTRSDHRGVRYGFRQQRRERNANGRCALAFSPFRQSAPGSTIFAKIVLWGRQCMAAPPLTSFPFDFF